MVNESFLKGDRVSILSRISEKIFGGSAKMKDLRASQEKRKVEKDKKAAKRKNSGFPSV